VYAESPRKLILTGKLDTSEIASLTDYCNRLHEDGQASISLDIAAVTDCHEAGLAGLLALVGGGSGMLSVQVEGAHWSQFMVALSQAPIADLQRLCDSVRQLVHPAAMP
jgi:ABC-type transporter Mla MlaB component